MSDQTGATSSRLPIIAAVVVVVAVVVGGLAVLFGGDDPDAVDSADALGQAEAADDGDSATVDEQPATDDTDSDTATDDQAAEGTEDTDDSNGSEDTGASDGTEGSEDAGNAEGADDAGDPQDTQTWSVTTEAVPYSFEDATGSFVGFRIDEELSNVGETEAVGRTPEVTGELTLRGSTIPDATFSGDPTAITTDRSLRDGRTRAAVGEGPLVFELTEPIQLDAAPAAGETITTDATGELTVNGVTQQYTVPLEASLSDSGLLVVTASFPVTLADHDVEAPRAGPVLSVSDVATVEVQLFLEQV